MFRVRDPDSYEFNGDTEFENPPTVFLQHGVYSSAFDWMANYCFKAPGVVLAKAGYDVWMGNNRGNHYSEKHEYLDKEIDASIFYSHSFEQLGKYDLPAQFDYVLNETGRKDLTYIGHS